jgi:hypothetical protein
MEVAVAVSLALGVAPVALAEPEAAEVAAKPAVVGEEGALALVRPVKKGSTAFCER